MGGWTSCKHRCSWLASAHRPLRSTQSSKEDDGSFLTVEYDRNRCPGDLGFDPLGFGSGLPAGQLIELHNAEVNLGRLAMIGITSFLFKDFLIKDPELAAKIL